MLFSRFEQNGNNFIIYRLYFIGILTFFRVEKYQSVKTMTVAQGDTGHLWLNIPYGFIQTF